MQETCTNATLVSEKMKKQVPHCNGNWIWNIIRTAPANFCQKKNSKNSYNGSTLNPPQLYVPWDLDFHIYEKETPCIAYLWRLFYTSFTTTTHFSTRLTYNPNKYFYQSELFEFWRNCSVPFLRINFDDWMVQVYRQEDGNLSHFLTDDKNFPHANKVARLSCFTLLSLVYSPSQSHH